jgi:hypothetical protein
MGHVLRTTAADSQDPAVMHTNRHNIFRALLLVVAVSGMAACGSRAAANEPSSNSRAAATAAELSAIAHFANAHGLIGGSPESLRPAAVAGR